MKLYKPLNTICHTLMVLLVYFFSSTSIADVSITGEQQFPQVVGPNESVTYQFRVTNTATTTGAPVTIRINRNGTFTNPSSDGFTQVFGCKADSNQYDCGDLAESNGSKFFSFSWIPPTGKTDTSFVISCGTGCKVTPDNSVSFTTVVPSFEFTLDDYQVQESSKAATIKVRKTGEIQGAVSALLRIGNSKVDSADAGVDYQLPASENGSLVLLTWENGDNSVKSVEIPIIDDNLLEGNERISLDLFKRSTETGSALAGTGTGTLLDSATLTILDSEVPQEGESPVNRIEIISGDRQRFTVDKQFDDLIIKVLFNRDPIEGLPVEWGITQGAGKLESTTTKTDKDGLSSNSFFTNSTLKTVIRATVKVSELNQINPKISKRLQPRAEGDDPFVEFVINPQISDTSGLSENEKSVAEALDAACPALVDKQRTEEGLSDEESDLLATCQKLQSPNASAGEVGTVLDQLAPEEVITQGTAVIETGNLQVMNVNARLNALRSNTRFDVSSLGFNLYGQRVPQIVVAALFNKNQQGGSAGENTSLSSPWSGFINGEISIGNKDQTTNETGFSFNSSGLTAGVDYRISNRLVLGTAIGYGDNDSDFDGTAGGLDMQSYHLTLYGTYYHTNQFYLDGLVRIGSSNYDTRRKVNSNLNQLILGDTDGTDQSISLNGGFEINKGAATLGSYGRIGYTSATIDAYTETATNTGPGSGSVLSIAKQDVESLTTVLGGQLSYAISRSSGVYLPQLRLEWEHEYNDDSRPISAHFVHDPTSTQFTISTDSPDRDYFNLGLGFSAIGSHGRSGFLYYETRIDQDNVEQRWLKSGFRWEFN